MVQILGLREFYSKKDQSFIKMDALFERGWRAASVKDALQRYEEILAEIPEAERYNLFLTASECTEKKRQMKVQRVIGFDIDHVVDPTQFEKYEAILKRVLKGLPSDAVSILSTGHGLHFVIEIDQPFHSEDYFTLHRAQYKALCTKMDQLLIEENLSGNFDWDFFKPKLLGFRFPGTWNKKKDLPDAKVELLRGPGHSSYHMDWEALSGLPTVKPNDQIDQDALREYPAVDTESVLSGCDFLKYCKSNQAKVIEPQWYAMLSILGRLQNSEQLAIEYSEEHPNFTPDATQRKLNQAVESAGPRTCDNIGNLWSGCHNCPNFGKVTSPIQIKGPDFIETASTGFHKKTYNAKGKVVSVKPVYEDLRRYFEKQHPYFISEEGGLCYVYNGTHFEVWNKSKLEHFAQEHFNPKATTQLTKEFQQLVCRTNLRSEKWFNESTFKKINLKNGVYDLETGAFMPHSMQYGFRYVLPYAFEPGAGAPLFQKFLDEVTCGDKDLQSLLMEFAGYCFSGDDCWTGKLLILVGEGSNGKSTFLDVLRHLAGSDNYSSLTMSALKKDTNLPMIEGRLFNLAEETPKYSLSETAHLKNLVTGGEAIVRHLYHKPYSIKNKTKFIFACNDLPMTDDSSHGLFRRFIIAPFNALFSSDRKNVDVHIIEKLINELPGIFNLCMDSYRNLIQRGEFIEPTSTKKALEEYREQVDFISTWFFENYKVLDDKNEAHFVSTHDLYDLYKIEAVRFGFQVENFVTFARKLSRIIPDYSARAIRKQEKGIRTRGVAGIMASGDGRKTVGNVTDLYPAF